MKKLQFISLSLIALFLFTCQSKAKNKNVETSSRETRTVDVTFTLDIEHDRDYKIYHYTQDVTNTIPGMIQDFTAVGKHNETIKGVTVHEGSQVKLAFIDATDCYTDDDCIYAAILSIKVNGELVANGRFNCNNGQGSGSIEYTFD